MKITKHLITLIILSQFSFSQTNLVPNGGFETYSSCPSSPDQLSVVSGWSDATMLCKADYFNACANSTSGVSVPFNSRGYQFGLDSSSGYGGIVVFHYFQNDDGRDYIQIKLSDTLENGKKYLATMFVVRNHYDFAISTLGMNFSANQIQSGTNSCFIDIANPQVKNTTPLTDTLNWMKIEDTIVGTGTELYLTIGNFSPDSLSDTLRMVSQLFDPYSYYYIDSVSVIDVSTLGVKEEMKTKHFELFPNPAQDELFLINHSPEKALLTISDINGKTVHHEILQSEKNNIKLELENGIYFVQLQDGKYFEMRKLIIAK